MYFICILNVYYMYIIYKIYVHTNFLFQEENSNAKTVQEVENYYPPREMVVLSAVHAALNPCKLKQTFLKLFTY